MGQIRGKKAHVSACNIRSLSSFGIPYAGMHILVSTDNSATEDGQGNFDAYVVGDGVNAAEDLPLLPTADAQLISGSATAQYNKGAWLCANSSKADYGKVCVMNDASYAVSDYIDVSNMASITFTALKGSGSATTRQTGGYFFYNSNKNFISGVVTFTTTTFQSGEFTVNIPDGVRYIRYTLSPTHDNPGVYTYVGKASLLNVNDSVGALKDGEDVLKRCAKSSKTIAPEVLKTNAVIVALSTDASFGEELTVNSANAAVTDYIDCEGAKKIVFKGLLSGSTAVNASRGKGGLVFYDSNKTAITSNAVVTQVAVGSWLADTFFAYVPDGASYYRYSLHPSDMGIDTIELDFPADSLLYKENVVNNLEDGGVNVPLSAEQGKVLLGLSSYTDERDTSVFTGEEQDSEAITITKSGDEWIIDKPGDLGYRGVGLFIGSIPTTKEYTWVIEYSSTSTKATNVSFSTLVNRQQATHTIVGAFAKNSSHAVLTFNATREADKNYLTVSSADMSNVSTITLHSIRVYNRKSVQELGAAIEEGNSGGGGSNTDYANVVSLFAEKKALADSMKHGDANFSCLLFSDLHGDTTNLSRIMDLYDNWEDYFTCGINVGDTIYDTINTGTAWYWTIVGDREFLFALGNHDVWGTDGGYNNAVEQAEYDAWIVPLVNKTTGLVRPSNADSALLPYYYKDYGNIRVIVLSTYTNRLSSDLTWFTGVLSDAITNSKKVIVVNHIAHSLVSRSGTTIQQNVAAEGDYNNGFKSYIYGNSQQGYVDAPSGDTDNVGNGFVVAVKTFMDNGGTFITWINGHCHRDFFTDLSGTTHETTCGKQAFITLSTARADYQNDNPKTWPDGTGMDSFYMFSVDEELGVFKLMKFGAETDYAMRPRKFLAYSYVEHKIVAQS